MANNDGLERDVKEFDFKQLCKFRVGSPIGNVSERLNCIAVSNKYGLIFVACDRGLKVISVKTIEEISSGDINVNTAVSEYPHQLIPVNFDIKFIVLNSDDSVLFLVYQRDNTLVLAAVDTQIIQEKDKTQAIFTSTEVVNTPGVYIVDAKCQPEVPSSLAVCLSNGHVILFQLIGNDIKVVSALAQGPKICSICWSPKGKQIIVGQEDGKIVQYDKILKTQKKVTPAPGEDILGDTKQVGGVFWISSYVFFAVYNSSDRSVPPVAVIVQGQKDGPSSYRSLEDIYFGYNEERVLCYYFNYIPEWQLMVTLASNALEAIPVGNIENAWQRWGLPDTSRAEMPLNQNNDETYPIGAGISMNSTLKIIQDEKELPPAPVFTILSSDNVLCAYQMVNKFPNVNHQILTTTQNFEQKPARRGANIEVISQSNVVTEIPKVVPSVGKMEPGKATGSTLFTSPSINPQSQSTPSFNFLSKEQNATSSFSFASKNGTASSSSSFSFAPKNPAGILSFESKKPVSVAASTPSFTLTPKVPINNSSTGSFNFNSNSGTAKTPLFTSNIQSSPLTQKPVFAQNISQTSAQPKALTSNNEANPNNKSAFSFSSFSTPKIDNQKEPLKQPADSVNSFESGDEQTLRLSKKTEPTSVNTSIQQKPLSNIQGTGHGFQSSNYASNNLSTPHLSGPINQTVNQPVNQTAKANQVNPPPQTDHNEDEVAGFTAKLDHASEQNIKEELNSFNLEFNAFMASFKKITEQKDLVGDQDELLKLNQDLEDVTVHVECYKTVMSENKNESAELREKVLKDFQMIDEAILRKEKMDDKRYVNVLKSRPLDPISLRQRKEMRNNFRYIEDQLNDINNILDAKWQENEQKKRNRLNNYAKAQQNQQIYKTIEAIDTITNHLSTKINNLKLKNEESHLISMNYSRSPPRNDSIKPSKFSKLNSSKESDLKNDSPKKFSQLRKYLSGRGKTPVRKSKDYSVRVNSTSDMESMINGKLDPKAASTPAAGNTVKTFGKFDNKMPVLNEEKGHTVVSDAFEKVKKLPSTIPKVLSGTPDIKTTPKAPDNTPVTPLVNPTPAKALLFKNTPGMTPSATPNKSFSSEVINKNLFASPVSQHMQSIGIANEEGGPPPNVVIGSAALSSTPSFSFAVKPSQPLTEQTNKDIASKEFSFGPKDTVKGKTNNQAKGFDSISNPVSFGLPSIGGVNSGLSENITHMSATFGNISTTVSFTKSTGFASSKPKPNVENIFKGIIQEPLTSDETEIKPTGHTFSNESKEVSNGISEVVSNSTLTGVLGTNVSSKALPQSFGLSADSKSLSTTLFGGTNQTKPIAIGNVDPKPVKTSLFGTNVEAKSASTGIFGVKTDSQPAPSSIFEKKTDSDQSSSSHAATIYETKLSNNVNKESESEATSNSGFTKSADPKPATNSLFSFSNASTLSSTGLFGVNTESKTTTTGLFGATTELTPANSTAELKPSSVGLFGTTTASKPAVTSSLFGATKQAESKSTPAGLFGTVLDSKLAATSVFGAVTQSKPVTTVTETKPASVGIFGTSSKSNPGGTSLFGASAESKSGSLFGATSESKLTAAGVFGTSTEFKPATTSLFGASYTDSKAATTGLFSSTNESKPASTGLFGTAIEAKSTSTSDTSASTNKTTSLFGSNKEVTASSSLFGNTQVSTVSSTNLFAVSSTSASSGLFGNSSSSSLFGNASTTKATSTGLFGSSSDSINSKSLFGSTASSSTGTLFGGATNSIFGNTSNPSTSLFSSSATTTSNSVFGSNTSQSSGGGLFGNSSASSGSIFATPTTKKEESKSASGGAFGGFGLGGKPLNDPTKNPFGSVPSTPQQQSGTSSLFGGASTGGFFGQNSTNTSQSEGGAFSKGFGSGLSSVQQQQEGFGASTFGTPTQQSQGPTFGGAPAFGGSPSFGSPPAFGGSAVFGGSPSFGSSPSAGNTGGGVFGGGATFGSGATGGSVFGSNSGNAPTFGSLGGQSAAPSFGQLNSGTGFGGNSGFGGNGTSSSSSMSGSQFSSWR